MRLLFFSLLFAQGPGCPYLGPQGSQGASYSDFSIKHTIMNSKALSSFEIFFPIFLLSTKGIQSHFCYKEPVKLAIQNLQLNYKLITFPNL